MSMTIAAAVDCAAFVSRAVCRLDVFCEGTTAEPELLVSLSKTSKVAGVFYSGLLIYSLPRNPTLSGCCTYMVRYD